MTSVRNEKSILKLGWVSLFNDVGSEVILRLVPLYVSGVLGAPMAAVGAIEGLADSTATFLKPVFGTLSDRIKNRKLFVWAGYGFSVLSRPLLALTGSWPTVAFLRFLDRVGKGVRTAPRDALIADLSAQAQYGKHFGWNRALDTTGALLGVGAFAAYTVWSGQERLTAQTWILLTVLSAVPGLIAVALAMSVEEPARQESRTAQKPGDANHATSIPSAERAPLNSTLKRYLLVVGFFTLANSSDAFILLKARAMGFDLLGVLGLIALLNVVSAASAIPGALLSDRFGRRTLICCGWVIYALSYCVFGLGGTGESKFIFAAGVSIYGLFYGFTESVERAWVAELCTAETRGRAYGYFGFVVGAVALPASAGFGWIWDHWGATAPFLLSAGVALVSAALLFTIPLNSGAQNDSAADYSS